MNVLEVHQLGKAYRHYGAEWRRVLSWFGQSLKPVEEHWVLRNISFSVAPGEAVGIVGQNGAGKSTLLKLITGTLRPTEGHIRVNGRIAAILELGTGFNPEFTGRQNVFHAAGLMGFNANDIARVMPEIEVFAEIGEYFDQPVRIYSSGMQMRVAFAVATAFRPNVLIVDEALSVGDIFFQQKCFDRIRGFRESGTTLLFVSHSMESVYSLCDRAMLIGEGHIVLDDEPKPVIDLYNARMVQRTTTTSDVLKIVEQAPQTFQPEPKKAASEEQEGSEPRAISGSVGSSERTPIQNAVGSYFTEGVDIESVSVFVEGQKVESILSESDVTIRIAVTFAKGYADPHVGFQIRDARGEPVFMTNTHCMRQNIGTVQAGDILEVDFSFKAALAPGQYTVTAGVANDGLLDGQLKESLVRAQNARAFSVLKNFNAILWSGVYNLAPVCEFRIGTHR